ncbi:MAG: hypothetical protein IAE93_12945 [Ignavibacteria bacterium]|nr:hypothetical protein [Ignavibacteria bacterium]
MDKKEKVFKYKGKPLTLRKKSFKPYRVKAITLITEYREYEKQYIQDVQAEIQKFLFSDKKAMGKIVTASNTNNTSVINNALSEILTDNPEYLVKAQELNERKEIARELFLTTDNDGMPSDKNAKTLCDIVFENASIVNHNPETESEYASYLNFLFEVFEFFFQKSVNLKNTAIK